MHDGLMLKMEVQNNGKQIALQDKVLLIGSCFTEHIGNYLKEHKLSILQNPNGILFDTLSVCRTLNSYLEDKVFTKEDVFFHNELWHSWQHHTMFNHTNMDAMLQQLNEEKKNATSFIKEADWLLITLGSSYAYQLKPEYANNADTFVANCHKVPTTWFEKYLIPIDEQIAKLDQTIYRIRKVNPKLKVVFTISPVRHIRDGVVENNRSKARLIETVHHLVNKFTDLYYFPAYEIVIDILRDYRFYDIDLVHPNYLGTSKVIELFTASFLNAETNAFIQKLKSILIAKKHKPFQPDTLAHQKFLLTHLEKTQQLVKEFPAINFEEEIQYFSNVLI